MSKRHKTSEATYTQLRNFLYGHGHVRHHKKSRAYSNTLQSAMEDEGGGAVSHRHGTKRNLHEAHLIPGVDGDGGQYGFPNEIITKLRYCDLLALTSTNGALGYNIFSANGIFDPDITGTGHQPMWRDNYAAIYNLYVVLGSKITVHWTPYTANANFICGVLVDDNANISSNLNSKLESNNSHWGMLSVGGSGPMTVVETFQPQQFGVDVKDDGFSSTNVGANPGVQQSYAVWVHGCDTGGGGQVVYASIEIEYTVKFSQLNTQAIS